MTDGEPLLPVTLLTGFLGAGKTTLLNRILTGSHDLRIGVVVNEFGALGVDASRLSAQRGPVVELLNGCICCASEGDLLRGLDAMLSGERTLDAVIIETSGLADPWPIVMGLDRWRFSRSLRLAGVVTMVDAANHDRNLDAAEAAFQQLTAADLIVINKADLVPPDVPARIAQAVGRLNPTAKTVVSANADLPLDVFLDLPLAPARDFPLLARHQAHAAFTSVTVRASRALDAGRFQAWVNGLPAGVLRAKGAVLFDGVEEAMQFDLVGSRPSLRPVEPSIEVSGCEIVLIGSNLSADQLQQDLQRCLA